MKNKRLRIVLYILCMGALIPVGAILIRDPIFMDSQERRYPDSFFSSYSSNGAFRFDVETILEALQQGETNSFVPIDATSGTQNYEGIAEWKQADYLLIANALHQFLWGETTDDWNLNDMSFLGKCNDQFVFDIAKISYAKPIGLQEYRFHMIGIYPRAGEGEWGGSDFPRSLFERQYFIDKEKLAIELEDALQIAENNGGAQTRLNVNDRCSVSVSLSPYPYPQWEISYSLVPTRIFEIKINAYTGEFEVLER